MAEFLSGVSAVAVILALISVGAFCGWKGWMTKEHKSFCVKLVVNIGIPAMCLNSLLSQVDRSMLMEYAVLVLISIVDIFLLMLLALLLVKLLRIPNEKAGSFVIMCAFSNTIFIGMPVCTLLFGDQATVYVLSYYIANTLTFQSVGLFIMRYFGTANEKTSWMKVLRGIIKPPLVTVVITLTMVLLGIGLPAVVMSGLKYLGNLVTPLALIYSGFILYENGLKSLRPEPTHWIVMACRFLAAPLLMCLMCRLVGISQITTQMLTVVISMPVMTQTVVFAADMGEDEHYAVIGMASSTVASFLVIPILMMLMA